MLQRSSSPNLLVVAALGAALVLVMPVYAQSEADCAARADRAARDSSGAFGGAVVGGAGGAAFGAIVSDKSSKGAKRGAALGAIAGGATGAYRKDQTYKRVFDDCMAGR
jgi:outer membrane lipoprotein SlyB